MDHVGGLLRGCSGLSATVSGRIFTTVLGRCRAGISGGCLPTVCSGVSALCGKGVRTCMSSLCTASGVASPGNLGHFLRQSAACGLVRSPTMSLDLSLVIGCCRVGRDVSRTSRRVRRKRHLFGSTVHHVCTSHGFCPSTGSAVQLDFKAIDNCSPFSKTACNCCAAIGNVFRGMGRRTKSVSFTIRPRLLSLLSSHSFNECTGRRKSVGIYFVSGGSVAKKGSNDTVFGNGKRLLNLTFSNG